jgi:hypothetical protein
VIELATASNIDVPFEHEKEWAEVLNGLDESVRTILAMDDYMPMTDLERYQRANIHVPTNNSNGGWALKVDLTGCLNYFSC